MKRNAVFYINDFSFLYSLFYMLNRIIKTKLIQKMKKIIFQINQKTLNQLTIKYHLKMEVQHLLKLTAKELPAH